MHENGKGIHGNLDGALTVVATPPKSKIAQSLEPHSNPQQQNSDWYCVSVLTTPFSNRCGWGIA